MTRVLQRVSMASLGLLFLLSIASAIFIHFISPLRDPTFEPNSANGGTLVPWLQGVSEGTWLVGGAILALLFSINLTIVLWLWSRAGRADLDTWFPGPLRRVAHVLFPARWFLIGVPLFLVLWGVGAAYFSYSFGQVRVVLAAALLSFYFLGIFWVGNQENRWDRTRSSWRGISRKALKVLLFLHWFVVGFLLFAGLQLMSLIYLLSQWLID